MTQTRIIQWDGREIRLSYTPRKFADAIDHAEITALDGLPLPITETGYKSHFFGPVRPALTLDEVEAFFRGWLTTKAADTAWQSYVQTTQQLSLF